MAQIQPVSVWKDGHVWTADQLRVRSIGDDLATTAQFYYELIEEIVTTQDGEGNDVTTGGSVVAVGNLTISGQDYDDWGNQSGVDINAWAYQWAATQLNLTIV